MLFLPLTHKDLHAHLHSLTSVESKGYGQNNCVWKIIGNKDFLFQKGKDKAECSGPSHYSHSVGEILRRGCSIAYNDLELLSLSYTQNNLSSEEC